MNFRQITCLLEMVQTKYWPFLSWLFSIQIKPFCFQRFPTASIQFMPEFSKFLTRPNHYRTISAFSQVIISRQMVGLFSQTQMHLRAYIYHFLKRQRVYNKILCEQ